jgi:hypothetical protein
MTRLHILVGGLALCVCTIALGLFAAWLNSWLAASLAFTTLAGLWCLAVVGALRGRGVVRVGCIAFAVVALAAMEAPDRIAALNPVMSYLHSLPVREFTPAVGEPVAADHPDGGIYEATVLEAKARGITSRGTTATRRSGLHSRNWCGAAADTKL